MQVKLGFLPFMYITVHLSTLNFSCHFIAQSKSFTTLNKLISSNLITSPLTRFLKSFMGTLNSKGPSIDLMELHVSPPSTAKTDHLFLSSSHLTIQ